MHRFTGDIMRRIMKLGLRLLFLGFLFCLGLTIHVIYGERVPPSSLTRLTIRDLERTIRSYYSNNGDIPVSLIALRKEGKYAKCHHDYWGRPIIYSYKGTVIRLVSYGKDGILGGTGDAADIAYQFDVLSNVPLRSFKISPDILEQIKNDVTNTPAPARAGQPPSQTA